MKRAGNLFDRIADRDNLRLAFSRASHGKRSRPNVRTFAENLEENLLRLQIGLRNESLLLGRHRQFVIHDPKERIITAPCFEERVLHHAVMNVCESVFEQFLIDDTFACRRGKGQIAALARAQSFARRFPAFLKLDIRKYFDSIPHANLLDRLVRRFKDRKLLDLFDRLVRGFRPDVGRGLPIGSLLSQHFANFYLGWLDRFVKEQLRVPGYVRYMDDMALWTDSTTSLQAVQAKVAAFLWDHLGLKLKAHPYVNHTTHGMEFLGARVFPTHMVLNRRSRVRFQHRLRALEAQYRAGNISERELQDRATALVAFTRTSGLATWRFRRAVLQMMPVSGQGLEPGEPGRELEQLRQELPVGEP